MTLQVKATRHTTLRKLSALTVIGIRTILPLPDAHAQKEERSYVVLEFADTAERPKGDFGTLWALYLKQLRSVPGFVSAERFQHATAQLKRASAASLPNQMIVVVLNCRDLAEIQEEIKTRFRTLNPAINAESARIFLYRWTGTWNSLTPAVAGDSYRQLVFGNSMPGREDEFNNWYNQTHARDLVTVPGVVSVSRFIFTQTLLGTVSAPPKYLSMMDFRTTSVEMFGNELDQMGSHFANTDAFDVVHAWRHLYVQVEAAP